MKKLSIMVIALAFLLTFFVPVVSHADGYGTYDAIDEYVGDFVKRDGYNVTGEFIGYCIDMEKENISNRRGRKHGDKDEPAPPPEPPPDMNGGQGGDAGPPDIGDGKPDSNLAGFLFSVFVAVALGL